jgi:hypothetical protein
VQGLISELDADHHGAFYNNLAPIDDDLEYQIAEYQKISFPEGREKGATDIAKMVDDLQRRLRAYQLFAKANL